MCTWPELKVIDGVNGDRADDRDRFSEGVTVKQRAVSRLTDGLPVMLVIARGRHS